MERLAAAWTSVLERALQIPGLNLPQLRLVCRCLLLLAAAALGSHAVLPEVREALALRDSVTALTNLAGTPRRPERELAELESAVAGLRHRVKGDLEGLPAEQLESFVISRLQSISWRHQIELSSIRPTPGERVAKYAEHLFQVELRGGYFEQLRWLQDLSNDLGFVVIKEFQLSTTRNSRSPDDPKLSGRALLAAYRPGEA